MMDGIVYDRPFQLLPDASLMQLDDTGLRVYFIELDAFISLPDHLEPRFIKRLKNPKNKINYISIDDWKILRRSSK